MLNDNFKNINSYTAIREYINLVYFILLGFSIVLYIKN